jgi:hypothetical protein
MMCIPAPLAGLISSLSVPPFAAKSRRSGPQHVRALSPTPAALATLTAPFFSSCEHTHGGAPMPLPGRAPDHTMSMPIVIAIESRDSRSFAPSLKPR